MIIIKKIISILLLVLLIIAAHFASADTRFSLYGFEDENSKVNWENNLFFKRWGEKFNIAFDVQVCLDYKEYKNFIANIVHSYSNNEVNKADDISNKEDSLLPDVFFKANFNSSEAIELYHSDIIIDLSEYIPQFMPNLNSILEKNSDVEDIITTDGKILTLPYINELSSQNYIWINQNWLNKLNLNMPETINEFKNVLSSFKENDPNENGKNDEIPILFNGIWDIKFLAHSFGIIADDFNLNYSGDNLVFTPTTANYYKFIQCIRDLYENKLIDRTCFFPNISFNSEKLKSAKYGVIISPTPFSYGNNDFSNDYVIMPPLKYNGAQIYRELNKKAIPGTIAISSACQNPAQILAALDYLYSEEGARLISVGMESVDYQIYDDGTWDWINSNSNSMQNILSNVTLSSGGFAPYVEPNNFLKNYSNKHTSKLLFDMEEFNTYLKNPMPIVHLSKEDVNFIQPYQNKIGKYTDESLTRFIIGEEELNEQTWSNFNSEIKKLGLDEFIQFWQNKITEKK